MRVTTTKASKFGMTKYRKNLKIPVFGGSRWYLVIFGFANSHFKSIWYFFYLQIDILNIFGKNWIWCLLVAESQMIPSLNLRQTDHNKV